MQCQTIRPGTECFFWKKSGCSNEGGKCFEVIEKCDGCSNIMELGETRMCKRFPNPGSKWLQDTVCSLATHVTIEKPKEEAKPINPLKASKRMSRGR